MNPKPSADAPVEAMRRVKVSSGCGNEPAGVDCCAAKGSAITALAAHAGIRRVLLIVLGINLAMFFVEFSAGLLARSTSLMADSVDMLGDALVYILSLYALDRGLRWRAAAALAKGALIALLGAGIAFDVALKLSRGVTPVATTMVVSASWHSRQTSPALRCSIAIGTAT